VGFKDYYKYLKEFEKFFKTSDKELSRQFRDLNNKSNKQSSKECRETRELLKKSFLFKLPKHLATLLYLTDNEDKSYNEEYHKLPYDYVFLDCDILYEGYKILGVLFYIQENTIMARFLIIKDLGGMDAYQECIDIFDKKTFSEENIKQDAKITIDDELRENIKCLILNFLEHINNPSIEFIHKEYSNSNYGGLSNKFYSAREIILSGHLKRYVYDLGQKMNDVRFLRKAHWVRGHWRRFYSEKFIHKKGTKTWVYPFIRGVGKADKKDYRLKDDCETIAPRSNSSEQSSLSQGENLISVKEEFQK
jgi:hypothetical protein